MRATFCSVVLAAALAPSSALAGTGNGQADRQSLPPPGEPVTTLVEGPTPVSPADVPAGGVAFRPPAKSFGTADCGACIVQCWGATTRSGSSDWSGHAYIYQHLVWCGNGAIVTYGQVSQSYEQAGWYVITATYGPWWSGGCLGCSNLQASGYILWDWRTPLVNVHSSGTSWLNTTVWAYGGVSF
jgi:hypothetical protein